MERYFSLLFYLTLLFSGAGAVISLLFFAFPGKKITVILKYDLFLTVFLYTAALILRTAASGHAPMTGLFESLLFFGWSICVMCFAAYLRFRETFFLPFSFPVLFLMTLKAYFSPWKISPLFPALKTIWFETHVSTSFLAYSLFLIGFGGGVSYLLKSFPRFSGILPEHEKIDFVIYRVSVWGFSLFSFSMLTGGIWAYLAWCNYFIWTPKEIWSILLWTFYAFYLHARLLSEWAGKRSAWLGILGFIFTMFTYLGVSLLMKSSHSL